VWYQSPLGRLTDNGQAPEFFAPYELDLAAARHVLHVQPGHVGASSLYGHAAGWPRPAGRAWPRLCVSYVADTIGPKPKPWHRLDAPVLSGLAQGQAESAPAVGLGEEYRLRTPRVSRHCCPGRPGRATHLIPFPVRIALTEVNQ